MAALAAHATAGPEARCGAEQKWRKNLEGGQKCNVSFIHQGAVTACGLVRSGAAPHHSCEVWSESDKA